jgi:muramoyltetrapeptide carboxypeptidase
MALQIGEGITDFSSHSLWNALRGDLRMPINFPPQYQPYPLRGGKAQGRLIGGCLSLVVSLLGTKFFGDISGKILFLEEIGEKPFRLDRMLTHLRNAGVFDRIAGLLLGDFHNCWTDDDSFTLPEMIEQILGHRKLPVLAGLPFGHSDDKMTLPLGIEIELDADKGEFNFLEKAVCCPGSEV